MKKFCSLLWGWVFPLPRELSAEELTLRRANKVEAARRQARCLIYF